MGVRYRAENSANLLLGFCNFFGTNRLWLFSLISHLSYFSLSLLSKFCANLVEESLLLRGDRVGEGRKGQESLCWVPVPPFPPPTWAAAKKPLRRGNPQLLNS